MTTSKDAVDYYQRKSVESIGRSTSSISEMNQTERDLSSQLILVATVIIGVTGAILAAGVFNNTVTVSQGILASTATLFALASIAYGIRYYFVLMKFNSDWAVAHQKVAFKLEDAANAFKSSNIAAGNKALDEANKITTMHESLSSRKHLYIEIVFLGLSSICVLVFALAVIFNWFEITGIKFL